MSTIPAKLCPVCGAPYGPGFRFCVKDGAALDFAGDREEDDALIGTVLDGRYELVSRLGKGGMGAVYLANQSSMDREVAVKVMGRDYAQDAVAKQRFMREARATSKLRHPNTVTVHDFGHTSDGVLYLVMERLEGSTLDAMIAANGAIPYPRAVAIAVQICDSLAEAHAAGIVHRDLKSENIYIIETFGNPEHVKVLDFGIAKVAGERTASLTVAGAICGTPEFMSPEQAAGDELDARSDIYSLGIILYQMLTGRLPYQADSIMGVLFQQLHAELPELPKDLDPAPPRALASAVQKMLAKDRNGRPESVSELKNVLEAAGKGKAVGFAADAEHAYVLPGQKREHGSSMKVLPIPVSLREERSAVSYQLLASDEKSGVLHALSTNGELEEGQELELRSVDMGIGPVAFRVRVAEYPFEFGGIEGCVLVDWQQVSAAKHRQYLVNVLRNILGVQAQVATPRDTLVPESRLVYDPAEGRIALTGPSGPTAVAGPRPGSVTPGIVVTQPPKPTPKARPAPRSQLADPSRPGHIQLTATVGFVAHGHLGFAGKWHPVTWTVMAGDSGTVMMSRREPGLRAGMQVKVSVDARPVADEQLVLAATTDSVIADPASGRVSVRLKLVLADDEPSKIYRRFVDHWDARLTERG